MENMGTLQQLRSLFVPQIPSALEVGRVQLLRGDTTYAAHSSDEAEIRKSFNFTYGQPLVEFVPQNFVNGGNEENMSSAVTRVGVVFGMEAESPGAHNVIAGIFDALKAHNNNSFLFGFVGGIEGLCSQKTLIVTDDLLKGYRNQGGCDLLGQSSKKIHEFQQMEKARSSCITLKLDGLVFVGGCSANTDAARLAEYFKSTKCQTTVVGVPVTLEGDLKNEFVETDVGFDTVCKLQVIIWTLTRLRRFTRAHSCWLNETWFDNIFSKTLNYKTKTSDQTTWIFRIVNVNFNIPWKDTRVPDLALQSRRIFLSVMS